jgi:ech hydrogenase subunit A
MHGLIDKAPVLTLLTALGMLSMLLPPFGVLITKWISIEAASSNLLVAIFLALGSAFTTVYYIKWLGTILSKPTDSLKAKQHIDLFGFIPVAALGAVIIGASIAITRIFNTFVSPEVIELLKSKNQLVSDNGRVYSNLGSFNDVNVFLVLIVIVLVVFIARKYFFQPKIKKVYLCGENNKDENYNLNFRNGLAQYEEANVGNIYLSKVINEPAITYASNILTFLFLIIVLTGGLICLR